jgi:hypothetical protein
LESSPAANAWAGFSSITIAKRPESGQRSLSFDALFAFTGYAGAWTSPISRATFVRDFQRRAIKKPVRRLWPTVVDYFDHLTLRLLVGEYLACYHLEMAHRGIGKPPPVGNDTEALTRGEIVC